MWSKSLHEPKIKTCAVALLDLLGYGELLRAASGQLGHPAGALAVDRVLEFHQSPMLQALPVGTRVFRLNDAIVLARDIDSSVDTGAVRFTEDSLNPLTISAAGAKEFWSFTTWARDLHDEIRSGQRSGGYPGARTMVVLGERLDGPGDDVLNLNMAFATAYLADQAGSKAGLGRDYMYIEWRAYTAAVGILRKVYPNEPDLVTGVEILGRSLSFLRCVPRPEGEPSGQKAYATSDKRRQVTDIFGAD